MSRELMSATAIPVLEAGLTRVVEMPRGLTISQMIDRAFPGISPEEINTLRVLMVTPYDVAVVHPDFWRHTRPKAHVQVILRLVPGDDGAARSVLTVVVSVAAMALGQFWASALVPTAGITQTLAGGLITAGLTVAGAMLLNALIPIQQPKEDKDPGDTYTIQGWQNTARPDEPVPFVLGRSRMAPPFAAPPFTTIVGDNQFVSALFTFGYGPLDISDLRIGETPIAEFTDVEIELREGRDDDEPITVYHQQVLEQREGVDLTRPREDGEWIDVPVVRQSAGNATGLAIIFAFSAGLFRVNDEGDSRADTVQVRIRQRAIGETEWLDVITLTFRAKKRKPFFRQYRWTPPNRGKWEIEVTKLTNDFDDVKRSRGITLAAIQSFRPEHPLNFDKPLALLGIRIKATDQLSGALDSINAIVQRSALDWDETNWTEGLSRNPATAYRAALQGPQNPFPVAGAEIDLEQLQNWHEWCVTKGLKYDHIHEAAQSFGEMLMTICAAGRASPRHDGVRWGVVIDRPDEVIVDHISPRNSADFRWQRNYLTKPHAFRVGFRDETNDWEVSERIVPWPGHVGDITLTEDLPLIGKTDPDEIWIEARRRQYELDYRPDSFSAVQDGGARVAVRGDTVMAAFDVLDRTLQAGRIMTADDRMITLDEPVEMQTGSDYALRYRTYADAEDAIGTSVVVPVITRPGRSPALFSTVDMDPPRIGEIAHFGLLGQESAALKVRGIEAGDGFAQVVHMVSAAPEIDTLTDAEAPPAWTGYFGEIIELDADAPAVPQFVSIQSADAGILFLEIALNIVLGPGAGSTVAPAEYELEYRISGDVSWITEVLSTASAGSEIGPFDFEEDVEIRARAKAFDGTPSAYTDVVTITVGSDLGEMPAALDEEAIAVLPGLGHARFDISVSDPETVAIQMYRAPAGDSLDPSTHAVGTPIPVTSGSTHTIIDGDSTRVNLALNPEISDASNWILGTGWSVTTDVATHASGFAGRISQATSALTGRQRIAVTISGRTAGDLTPVLTGSDEVDGTAITANGTFSRSIDADAASSDPDGFGFDAGADFDGSIDEIVRYRETASCLDAGAYDYYFAPHNVANVPGPFSDPFSVQIL